MISDKTITIKEVQTQQNKSSNTFPREQNWTLVERKNRYPLPRHLFNNVDLSVNINVHVNIGFKKFDIAMILAKT